MDKFLVDEIILIEQPIMLEIDIMVMHLFATVENLVFSNSV